MLGEPSFLLNECLVNQQLLRSRGHFHRSPLVNLLLQRTAARPTSRQLHSDDSDSPLKAGQQPSMKAGTNNLEAYQLYLEGRELLYRRGHHIQRAL